MSETPDVQHKEARMSMLELNANRLAKAMEYLDQVKEHALQQFPDKQELVEKESQEEAKKNFALEDKISKVIHALEATNIDAYYTDRMNEIFNRFNSLQISLNEPRVMISDPDATLDQEIAKDIESANSFDDLYNTLEVAKHIPGTSKIYTAKEVITSIETYRKSRNNNDLLQITRTAGLRDKVAALRALDVLKDLNQSVEKKLMPEASKPQPVIAVQAYPPKKNVFKRIWGRLFN